MLTANSDKKAIPVIFINNDKAFWGDENRKAVAFLGGTVQSQLLSSLYKNF